jgi:hypothetical protein
MRIGNPVHVTAVAVRDSIVPQVGFENAVVTNSNLFQDPLGKGAAGPACISADPMFVDGKNFDYRLKRGSPCIGKASDGGDIGCRYTPEMIELCKVALDLRRKGTLKF